jgi:hypothetical protein
MFIEESKEDGVVEQQSMEAHALQTDVGEEDVVEAKI